MAKIFKFRGKVIEEIKQMKPEEFANMVPSRERRTLKRSAKAQAKLVAKVKKSTRPTRTHMRNLIVTPDLLNKVLMIYDGREFVRVDIMPEMMGKRLGELTMTRRRVKHSAPGMGATKSSKFVALK